MTNYSDPTLCRQKVIINGKTWICIKPNHQDPERLGHGFRSEQWGPGTNNPYPPKPVRHYFVRMWPGTNL